MRLFAVLCVALLAPLALADDGADIDFLLADLSSGSLTLQQALDPELTGDARTRELETLDSPYAIRIERTSSIKFSSTDSAEAQLDAEWKSGNTTTNSSKLGRFVRRGNRWYLADFEFLRWGWVLITVFVVSMFIAVGWGSVGLTLIVRLERMGLRWKDKNYIKVLIPFFWPQLFRLTRRDAPATA